jgi:hypothetical protein
MSNHAATGDKIRGAIYIPARAFNAYQMWRDYNRREIERDLGYAARLNLNALRVWVSYEYWLERPEAFESAFDHFLQAAFEKGIRIMPSLFEKVGVEPTREALTDTNPLTACCTFSPASEIFERPERHGEPKRFVDWFMDRYRDDGRLLAIELMNEPVGIARITFARAMLRAAAQRKGTVPLTVGCVGIEDNIYFLDIGVDVLQHHDNFPNSAEQVEESIRKMLEISRILNKPCWITEWQRFRRSAVRGEGGSAPLLEGEWQPDYAPYARILAKYPIGTFFWSLMLKPAYLPGQRRKGTLNGVFHEDGAVWSLEDARAISGNPDFQAEERRQWPEWAKIVADTYLKVR